MRTTKITAAEREQLGRQGAALIEAAGFTGVLKDHQLRSDMPRLTRSIALKYCHAPGMSPQASSSSPAPETSPDQPRYVGAAVETDNAEGMRLYLRSMGFSVPDKVEHTPTHDLAFPVTDPDGNAYEILQYTPQSLSVQTVGRFLGNERASTRILHVGISIRSQQTVDFYLKGFSLREFWRADPSMSALGAPKKKAPAGPLYASLSNLKLPEGDDYIEWSLMHGNAGSAAKGGPRVGTGHIALLVDNMAQAVAFVKAKPAWKDYVRPAQQQQEAHTGVNHKWQGNFFDPDGTRSEFMEPDTADGLPSPMSHAPYYP